MEYVYATLLLHTARKEISEASLRKILEAAGIAVDEIRLKSFVAAIKEINLDEILKSALTTPLAPAPSTPTAAPAQAQPAPAEEKKEEEKKEAVSEEQLAEGLAALFG